MSYTITSAAYANAENTAVLIQTTINGAVLVSQQDRPDLWADLQTWVAGGGVISAYVAPSITQAMLDTMHNDAIVFVGDKTAASAMSMRAVLVILLDEINFLRERLRLQDDVVGAATTLANFKSGWATMAGNKPMPDRTKNQAKTAYNNKVNGGTVDHGLSD